MSGRYARLEHRAVLRERGRASNRWCAAHGAFSNTYLRRKCNPNQIPADFYFLFFSETDGLIRKFIWKYRKPAGKAKAASSTFSARSDASPAAPPRATVLRAGLQAQAGNRVRGCTGPSRALRSGGSQLGCRLGRLQAGLHSSVRRLAVIC